MTDKDLCPESNHEQCGMCSNYFENEHWEESLALDLKINALWDKQMAKDFLEGRGLTEGPGINPALLKRSGDGINFADAHEKFYTSLLAFYPECDE